MESIGRKEEQGHSHKYRLAVGALALALLTGCESHFPNDKFLMNVENRSGTINFQYNRGKNGETLHYDIIVKEDGDSGYIAYVTVGPAYGSKRTYTVKAKDMGELKSKLEYDLSIARSEDIFTETELNTQNKITSFAEAYNSFLKDSEPMFIKIREQKLRLNDIKSEIQALKKDKPEHNKEMIKGLQQEKRSIERWLKDVREPSEPMFIEIREQELRLNDIKSEIQALKKDEAEHNKEMIKGLQQEKRSIERWLKDACEPIEVPYNKDTHSTGN